MSYWSDKFNALSKEHRTIGAAMELQLRIQHLDFEIGRHKEAIRKAREHQKNCKEALRKMELKDSTNPEGEGK